MSPPKNNELNDTIKHVLTWWKTESHMSTSMKDGLLLGYDRDNIELMISKLLLDGNIDSKVKGNVEKSPIHAKYLLTKALKQINKNN